MKKLFGLLKESFGEEDLKTDSLIGPSSLHDAEYFLRIAIISLKEASARVEANRASDTPKTDYFHVQGSLARDGDVDNFLNSFQEDLKVATKTVKGIRKKLFSSISPDNESGGHVSKQMEKTCSASVTMPTDRQKSIEGEKKMKNVSDTLGTKRSRTLKNSENSDSKGYSHTIEEEEKSDRKRSSTFRTENISPDNSLDLGQYASQKEGLFGGNDAKKNKFARLMGGAKISREGGEGPTHHAIEGKTSQEINQINENLAKEFDFALHHKAKKGLGA